MKTRKIVKKTGAATMRALPKIDRNGNKTILVVDNKPFYVLGAEVQNSSASCLTFMEPIWKRLADLHCNTVLAPVYWELLEPVEGTFDFTLVKGLLEGARAHGLRLILLWFGTWKNGDSCYAPAWVKQDLKRFPRAQSTPGKNARNISPFSRACRDADARAFVHLMRFLKRQDRQHTVIMVQIENEVGHLRSPRDCSPPAEHAFAAAVPARLMRHLTLQRRRLIPAFRSAWESAGGKEHGTWCEVFGDVAAETFMAWYIAEYVEYIAAAGKREYPLPVFVNAWLDYHSSGPGHHPSGGPVARMHDVWRAAAPSIDAFAPDIYGGDFKMVCRDFAQAGNPLIIPETSGSGAEANVFWAIAEMNALCFAPFGIDGPHPWGVQHVWDVPRLPPSYRILSEMMPFLGPHLGTERLRGILQTMDEPTTFELGGFRIQIRFARKLSEGVPGGYGLIVTPAPNTYVIAGIGFSVSFHPLPGRAPNVDFLAVEEGSFSNGQWQPGRRLNGDDTVAYEVQMLQPEPVIRRAVLYEYDDATASSG